MTTSTDLLDYPSPMWNVLASSPTSVIGPDWLRWFQRVHTVLSGPVSSTQGVTTVPPQSGSGIATTTLATAVLGGAARINWYLELTAADGHGSSLQVTVGWEHHGQMLTRTFPPLTADTLGANDSASVPVVTDANAPITYAVSYTSTTGATQFSFSIWVLQP